MLHAFDSDHNYELFLAQYAGKLGKEIRAPSSYPTRDMLGYLGVWQCPSDVAAAAE